VGIPSPLVSQTLTTIKLGKKSSEQPVAKAGKAPVRRNPILRDRTKPFVKPIKPEVTAEKSADKPSETRPVRTQGEQNTPKSSQRNHRYDGKPREVSEAKPPYKPTAGVDTRQRRVQDETGRDTPRRGGKARDGFEPGEFNRDRASNPKFSPKPTPSQPDLPRLSKLMAERGICSRREADEWIVNGWVMVDGAIIETLGTRVQPDANIIISGYAKEHQSESVTIILNKPVGYVSGQAEDGYEPAVVLIHPDNQWAEDPVDKAFQRGFLKGLAPAGRLDIDSTGLLVLTQDGRVARQLIGDDSNIEKEYLVRVEGELSEAGLKKLNHGLELDGVQLKPAKVSWQNEDQLRFVLREGRKRQIRRMCELVGLHVVGLKRVRIGSVNLGKLPQGQWRYLRTNERF
jgi:23S rRNA pseudouridine2604 synthase